MAMSRLAAPAAALTVTLSDQDPRRIRVTVVDNLDLSTAEQLRTEIDDVLGRQRPSRLDVDLAQVTFVDSCGIRALLRCQQRAAELGCHLTVVRVQPVVAQVLWITGVLETLTTTPAPTRARSAPPRARAEAPGSRHDPPPAGAGSPVRAQPPVGAQPPGSAEWSRFAVDLTPAQASRREAAAVRAAARRARERAQAMLDDNAARRARIRRS